MATGGQWRLEAYCRRIYAADAASSPSVPRGGTKLAQVVELLQRDDGATLDELVAATGWLPHTTRAALTGLRRRGYAVPATSDCL